MHLGLRKQPGFSCRFDTEIPHDSNMGSSVTIKFEIKKIKVKGKSQSWTLASPV